MPENCLECGEPIIDGQAVSRYRTLLADPVTGEWALHSQHETCPDTVATTGD